MFRCFKNIVYSAAPISLVQNANQQYLLAIPPSMSNSKCLSSISCRPGPSVILRLFCHFFKPSLVMLSSAQPMSWQIPHWLGPPHQKVYWDPLASLSFILTENQDHVGNEREFRVFTVSHIVLILQVASPKLNCVLDACVSMLKQFRWTAGLAEQLVTFFLSYSSRNYFHFLKDIEKKIS